MEEDQGEYPDSLLYHFPSQLRLDALPELVDISVSRTLLTALLTALKANGKGHEFCIECAPLICFKRGKWNTNSDINPPLWSGKVALYTLKDYGNCSHISEQYINMLFRGLTHSCSPAQGYTEEPQNIENWGSAVIPPNAVHKSEEGSSVGLLVDAFTPFKSNPIEIFICLPAGEC